jgi:streptomycin 6-kinase
LREGKRGQQWLDCLPALVDRFMQLWQCRPDGAVRHGEVAIVVPVRSNEYGSAVLKISYPSTSSHREAHALRGFNGRGAVRVFAADEPSRALLLERAGPRTLTSVSPTEHAIEIAGALTRTLAVPAPPGTPTLAHATYGWEDELDRQLALAPRLVPPAVISRARATMRMLRAGTTPTLMHGDLHFRNVLRADREPWLAIDPIGWQGTAAFDAFTVVAERPDELYQHSSPESAMRARVHRYAAAASVDPETALACCQARATSSYLHQHLTNGTWFDNRLLQQMMTIGEHEVT